MAPKGKRLVYTYHVREINEGVVDYLIALLQSNTHQQSSNTIKTVRAQHTRIRDACMCSIIISIRDKYTHLTLVRHKNKHMAIKINDKSDKRSYVPDTSALELKYSQITNQKKITKQGTLKSEEETPLYYIFLIR